MSKAVEAIRSGGKLLIGSPTGSGKSLILAGIREEINKNCVVLTPSFDVLKGLFLKAEPGRDATRANMERHGFYTSRRYHNLLLGAAVPLPKALLIDESHHDTNETTTVIRAVCNDPPMAGVTATLYRGTAEGTAKLRDLWGPPHVALSLKAAVEKGIIARPDFSVWPLVNDETITVSGGEFSTEEVEAALDGQYDDVARRIRALPTRATMVRCPGVGSAALMYEALGKHGVPVTLVTGESRPDERETAFRLVSNAEAVLVQVKVVGEGVDLPVRRLIDLAPTMSPVAWMQAVGRITRPLPRFRSSCQKCGFAALRQDGHRDTERHPVPWCPRCGAYTDLSLEAAPEYITTNHNLTRHAYLWEGLIPASQVAAAQKAWGPNFKPGRRSLARALGLEGFGKFVVSPVPMIDGSTGSLYSLQTQDGLKQYAVFLHPCMPDPLYFARDNALTGRRIMTASGYECNEKAFGKWRRAKAVPPAEGYLTVKPRKMSEKMQTTWEELAERKGFDPAAQIDGRVFEALFMFLHTGSKYQC